MIPLDDPRWGELECHQGTGAEIAVQLQELARDPTLVENAWVRGFWARLHTEGVFRRSKFYNAGYAAIPHLVSLAEHLPEASTTRAELLMLVGEIAFRGAMSIHGPLTDEARASRRVDDGCPEALRRAAELILQSLINGTTREDSTARRLFASLARVVGYPDAGGDWNVG